MCPACYAEEYPPPEDANRAGAFISGVSHAVLRGKVAVMASLCPRHRAMYSRSEDGLKGALERMGLLLPSKSGAAS